MSGPDQAAPSGPPAPAAPSDQDAAREVLLLVAGGLRRRGRLDAPAELPVADPPLDAVVDAAARAPAALPLWLGGGEPTLRADLPALLRALPARPAGLGLETDGLALAAPGVAQRLAASGLTALRIPLHAVRPDAHDWLVDQPGATRRVVRALRLAVAAGLQVEGEVVLTRPTTDLLPETVAALARLGLARIIVRRVEGRGAAGEDFIALSPRLGLAQPLVERAVRVAASEGVEIELRGFPRCAAGAAAAAVAPVRPVLSPGGAMDAVAAALQPRVSPGCPGCEGPPACLGAPLDYIARFGRTELDDRCSLPPRKGLDLGTGEGPSDTPPPPRAGRTPATRLVFAARQAARGDLHGDPLAGVPGVVLPDVVQARFPPDQPTRPLRQELVVLAQQGAATLRIADHDSLRHPEIGSLLRETVRFTFQRIEVAGPVDGLAALPDRMLIGLRGLSLLVALVEGPDATHHDAVAGDGSWAATQETLARFARLARCQTRVAVVPRGQPLPADLFSSDLNR